MEWNRDKRKVGMNMICRKCSKEIQEGSLFCNYCGAKQEVVKTPKKRGNGQGSVYKRGNVWEAAATRYEGTNRIVKRKSGFKKKKDALDWLSTVKFSTNRATITFEQLYKEWSALHYPTIAASKSKAYVTSYKKASALYNMKWNDIGLRHMQSVVNSLKETYYPRKYMKTMLSMMSKYAIVAGYSDRDFTANIKLPPMEKPHKVAFSDEEINALWNDYNAGNDFTGAILLMIYTGMRYGELSDIRPENVHIEESYLMGGKKTAAGKEGEILLLDIVKPIAQKLLVDGGLPKMSSDVFRRTFNRTLERCQCRRHTIHECRHTTATALAKAGVQPAVIKEIMRHSKYSQTIEYTHIDRETKLKELQKLDRTTH